ncbi:MAG: GcrA cell cycle regulator, partial [Alphaproteobacteria bacterium]|nr:GcrA cell cycle regulator [Alphaproteobacteria bacterium]
MQVVNWTDDRVEQLKNLWTEGLSASQIARALGGVTRNAVIGKVHRLGLAGRASPSRSERPRLPMAPKVSLRQHTPPAPVVEEDPVTLGDG